MLIIVGLGNPEKKHKNTRHNIGFEIIDAFRKKNNFPKFKLSKKFNSLISEDFLSGKKVVLVKPQTFMNQSGKAVRELVSSATLRGVRLRASSKFQVSKLIVAHDDIDLPLGKIRIVKSRGSAGHKGVESIIREIGTKNFIRFRVGIQLQKGKPTEPEKFVLKKFSKKEEKIVKKVIGKTTEAIETLITEGLEKTMSEYNK